MGLLSQITGGVINDDGPIVPGWNNPTQSGGGGWNPFGGGSIIPGLDNPFQSGDKAWLPGVGQLNPLNSQSAVGQAVKDIGNLNPFNPDTTAAKVVNNIAADIGKDPVKWAAMAVAVAAGQPQLIPYINGVAKVTSKNSTPEEWLTEGVKAYAMQAGGDWLASKVAGLGPQTDVTTGETFAGTGVRGATDSAAVARVAANTAKGMFVAAARNGTTDINGGQIITGALSNEGLNQAMSQIPGFDQLDKADQAKAVNAFKVAFNKDQSAAYNLLNQGFQAAINGAEREASKLGYNTLDNQVRINDAINKYGTAEDRSLLNKYETDYKTASDRTDELRTAWRNAMGNPTLQNQIDNEISAMADLHNRTVRNLNTFAADLSSRSAGLHDDFDTATGADTTAGTTGTDTTVGSTGADTVTGTTGREVATGADTVTGTTNTDVTSGSTDAKEADVTKTLTDAGLTEGPKSFQRGDLFGTGEQVALYPDGRVQGSNDATPRAPTADEAKTLKYYYDNYWGAMPQVVLDALPKEANVVDDLTKAGLHDDFDTTDLTKVVGGTDTVTGTTGTETTTGADTTAGTTGADTVTGTTGTDTTTGTTGTDTTTATKKEDYLSPAIENLKAGNELEAVNFLRRAVGLEPFATIEDYYASNEYKRQHAGADDGTAMGDTTKPLPGAEAYKYDPANKTYTFTDDLGSTITLDENGNVVGSTEAAGEDWSGLTDTATGNLKLPKLPGGITPTVKAPAKKTTTTTNTTTGTGNTAVTTGSSTVVQTGGGTAIQTSGGLNIGALMAIMAGLEGNQQAQQPQIETYDPGKGFEYFDWESDPFAPKTKEKTNPTAQPKMAEGGSIDELLEILRRSGI